MSTPERVVIGNATLYHGDALEAPQPVQERLL